MYVVEHPNHICTLHALHPVDETAHLSELLKDGIIWFEKLGPTNDAPWLIKELLDLARKCSRPLLHLPSICDDTESFVPLEQTQKLLHDNSSEYDWTPRDEDGAHVFLRFSPAAVLLVRLPYERFADRTADRLCVPLYIQETMTQPICTLSVDPQDLTYAEGHWRECLGGVQANVVEKLTVDVSLEDVNRLVRKCSRPMLLVSHCLPPTYIPRHWLEIATKDLMLCLGG
jgi:hypothetical protein